GGDDEVRGDERPIEQRQLHGAAPVPAADGGVGPCPSITETTASASCTRTGPRRGLSRVGSTRLVSRMTKRSRAGSIQIEVPVNPVWPNARCDSRWPAELFPLGTSHPRARLESTESCTCVNVSIAAG